MSYPISKNLLECPDEVRRVRLETVFMSTRTIHDLRFHFGRHKNTGLGHERIDGSHNFLCAQRSLKIAFAREPMQSLGEFR